MIMGFDVGLQYLDENKQLILAILDNQNLGKLNECASYVIHFFPTSIQYYFLFSSFF
jgi:hypothetical protein